MKQLTAHTQVTITHENGATKVLLFKDFLLALPSYHANRITIDYAQYVYDSFVIELPIVSNPKTSVKREPKAKNAETEVKKTVKETVVEKPEPTIPKESQPPPS